MSTKMIACLALMLMLSVAGEAFAGHDSLYAGGGCVAYNNSLTRQSGDYIYNYSTSTNASVFCPIVRQSQTERLQSARMYVRDGTTTGAVTCTLFTQSETGAGVDTESHSTVTGDVHNTALIFGAQYDFDRSHNYFICTLPYSGYPTSASSTSRIYNYTIQEN